MTSKTKSILQHVQEARQTNEDATSDVITILRKADYLKDLAYRAKGTVDSSGRIDKMYLLDIKNTIQELSTLAKKLK